MEKSVKFDSIQPRSLRYRGHYKIYLLSLMVLSGFVLFYWGHRLSYTRWSDLYSDSSQEIWASLSYFFSFGVFYFSWLRSRLHRSIQVYPTSLSIHHQGKLKEIHFDDIVSVKIVCWSVFYVKVKDGSKYFFSSSLERVDYVWEGLYTGRPDLFSHAEYELFRTKLVQYDHHQKRKEWFFRHKFVDVFNWIVLPLSFIFFAYFIQSRDIVIQQQGMYFFRLAMYSALTLLATSLLYSIILKKFIFDKKILMQISNQTEDKVRDLEFEGVILQRSKILQFMTIVFVFGIVMKSEMNLFSLTKIKEDLTSFNLKSGQTLVVDNRYNCLLCKYPVRDGDLVVFGKGTVGQIMATEGDMIGQISQDKRGRTVASENIQEVPKGYIAVKLANQKDMALVKVDELIGKLQK